MVHQFWITRTLNFLFGPAVAALLKWSVVAALLNSVGLHPAASSAPINNTFALEALVAFGLLTFFLIVRFTLSVEKPNVAQHLAELIHEFTGTHADQIIGHGYERFQAFVTCIFLFVLFNNLLGLIPGVVTPTSAPVVPLGIAVAPSFTTTFTASRSRDLLAT